MTGNPSSDPSAHDDSNPGSSRRDRLAARKRRRVRIGVLLVAGALVCGAAGLFAAFETDTGRPAQAADPKVTTTQPGAPDAVIGTSPAAAVRPLDHAHPLRLWVGGDSLAGSFGPSLGDDVGATGVVQTVVDFKVSSGLWSDDIRDWDARATEQMATNPDAVVFIIGTNDAIQVNQVDANGDGVPDWVPEYRAKVDRMMDILVGTNHRPVIWLGAPTLGDPTLNEGAKALDQVMQEEASKRRADVTYIDTYKLFSSRDGGYSRSILGEKGNAILARLTDGVHFTQDGAGYLAGIVFKVLDAHWHLTKQADPTQPIGWTWAPGSVDTVPGYSATPRSRYGSSSSSSSGSQSGSSSRHRSYHGTQSPTTASGPTPANDTPTSFAAGPTPTNQVQQTPVTKGTAPAPPVTKPKSTPPTTGAGSG